MSDVARGISGGAAQSAAATQEKGPPLGPRSGQRADSLQIRRRIRVVGCVGHEPLFAVSLDVASGGVACDSAPMQRRWHLRLAVLCFADGPCGVVL